jgi:hypothetical protein
MPAHRPISARRSFQTLGGLALLLTLAACGTPQQSAMLYDTTRESTRQDAESHAMGESSRAASQIQLGFGSTTPERVAPAAAPTGEAAAVQAESAAAAAARPRALAEARSFLGTVPCPSGLACEASRFVVTLAPSGEWRSRTTLLVGNEARQTLVDQGCWSVIGESPLRIALTQPDHGTSKADLSFVNNNTLRVHSLNGAQPVLEHSLTRQADLDPINELKDRPALAC